MAPHERFQILWPCLLVLLLFAMLCSGHEVHSHRKFATQHRSLGITPSNSRKTGHSDVVATTSSKNDLRDFANNQELKESEVHHKKVVNPGGNHLYVSKTGNANFNRIQAAIDSIPEGNEQWVQIDIAAGVYQ